MNGSAPAIDIPAQRRQALQESGIEALLRSEDRVQYAHPKSRVALSLQAIGHQARPKEPRDDAEAIGNHALLSASGLVHARYQPAGRRLASCEVQRLGAQRPGRGRRRRWYLKEGTPILHLNVGIASHRGSIRMHKGKID